MNMNIYPFTAIEMGWDELANIFQPFGWSEVTFRYGWGCADSDELEIRIYLAPNLVEGADMDTDEGVRRAVYEQAERAIKTAKKHFQLVAAPRLEVDGDFHWNSWPYNYTIVTSNVLTLRVTGKPVEP